MDRPAPCIYPSRALYASSNLAVVFSEQYPQIK